MGERVAFFDIDRTLISINSATLWVKHEWRGGRLSTWNALYGGWKVLEYNLGIDRGMDEVYRQAVRLVAGQEESELGARSRTWFRTQVAPFVRPGALDAIERHREAGHRLVIATSSSPYAAAAAAELWGFEHAISTVFEVRDGVLTGDIEAFAYGDHKADRVAEWAEAEGVDLEECTFYTDSVTDLKLLEAVGTPVAVNPDKPLARIATERGWSVVDWGAGA